MSSSMNFQTISQLTKLFNKEQEWLQKKLIPLVEDVMKGYNDPSHDMLHVERVVLLALSLAESEWPLSEEANHILAIETSREGFLRLVVLAAMCHDVGDHKYEDSARLKELIRVELASVLGDDIASCVFEIGGHVSWSLEQKEIREFGSAWRFPHPVHQKVLECVQDADRLDAIGAIGFARCVAFGAANGKKGFRRVIDHWHEKLKMIPSFMKTSDGKKRSKDRVDLLEVIINGLEAELIS